MFFLILLGVVAAGFVWLSWVAGPDTALRMIYYNDTHIDDFKLFPARRLRASPQPFRFRETGGPARVPEEIVFAGKTIALAELLGSTDTVGFLVVKDETILYERYFQGYSSTSLVQAFSMSKSFLSVLVGCAIDDGLIPSEDLAVTHFLPELSPNGFDKVTIKHLLQMTSGSNYRQGGFAEINPFGLHPRFEYTPRLEKEILKLKITDEPGSRFIYKSGDTAILSLILKRALKTKTITDYMQEKIWTPLGMESDAVYTLDHKGDGLEKTWCCLAATARDFAKFGQLYLNEGEWRGVQIVSKEWVRRSTSLDPTDAAASSKGSAWEAYYQQGGISGYKYHWWMLSPQQADFLAIGKAGQYVYVNPAKQIVIVRLGRRAGRLGLGGWIALFRSLADLRESKRRF